MSQFGNNKMNPCPPANLSPSSDYKITPQLYGGSASGFVGASITGTPNGSGPTFNVNANTKGNYGASVGWKWTF